jgi:hypothetical protein
MRTGRTDAPGRGCVRADPAGVGVNGEHVVRVRTVVAEQGDGTSVSIGHVCAAAVARGVNGIGPDRDGRATARETVYGTDR